MAQTSSSDLRRLFAAGSSGARFASGETLSNETLCNETLSNVKRRPPCPRVIGRAPIHLRSDVPSIQGTETKT